MNKPAAALHIFRAGTHVAADGKSYSFSEADVADLAASYDPQLSRAPLVVGHPKTDDPAYGWTGSLRFEAGNLFGTSDYFPFFVVDLTDARFRSR